MVQKCGLINLIKYYEDNKSIMYAVEKTLREELKKLSMDKTEVLRITDDVMYKTVNSIDETKLRLEAKRGNIYAEMYLLDDDDCKDPEKLEKYLHSEHPGVLIELVKSGLVDNEKTRLEAIEILRKRVSNGDTKALHCLGTNLDDIDALNVLYKSTGDEKYLWDIVRVYYDKNDLETMRKVRPAKYLFRITTDTVGRFPYIRVYCTSYPTITFEEVHDVTISLKIEVVDPSSGKIHFSQSLYRLADIELYLKNHLMYLI
jgi:hypothetical protein